MNDTLSLADMIEATKAAEKRLAALKKEHKQKEGELQADIDRARGVIHQYLLDNAMDSVKTDAGTATLVEDVYVNVEDWEAYYYYITKTGQFELLQKRPTKQMNVDYFNQNGEPIPGAVLSFAKKLRLS